MGEIASAYVRIRPNMAGFKSETQAGVKSAFSGLSKLVGIAFGGVIAGEIIHGSVEAAANLQKQVEAVRFEFGRASKELIEFAETTGIAMGDAKDETLAASSAFGRIFQSIGIGGPLAAEMTKGFEELALSINAIQGGGSEGAASMLRTIALAAAGNTRGLKRLGIVADTTAIKQGYFELTGRRLVGTLNAQQKAIGIYAVATKNLPMYLAEARKHSGDLANVQARLSAEWAEAKEQLGTALLPSMTRGATVFADWLKRMTKSGRLSHDFAVATHVAGVAVHLIVGVVRAGLGVWNGFAHAVGGARNALILLGGVFAVNKIRKFGAAIRADVNGALARTRAQIAANVAAQKAAAVEESAAIRTRIAMYTKEQNAAKTTAATVKATSAKSASAIKASAVQGEVASTGLWTSMKVGALTTVATIKAAFMSTLVGAVFVAIGIAVGYILTHWDQVKRYTMALVHASVTAFKGMGNIIVGVYQYIYGKAFYYIVALAKHSLDLLRDAAGWIPWIGGKISDAADAVDRFADSTHAFAESGRRRIIGGFSEITHGVVKAWNDSLKQAKDSSRTKHNAHELGKETGQAVVEGVNDSVAGLAKTLNAALQQTIDQAHERIRSAIQKAKDNLVRIGSDLSKTIDRIKEKMGGAAGSLASSPQGQAFAKLKKLIETGAPSFQIARARAELSSQLTGVGKQAKAKSSPASHQLADLTSAFNQGKITYAQFTNRLHRILRENGITLAKALKTGGKAFADTYKAQVAALGKQAAAINAVPKSLRGVGGAGGPADINIVQPMKVIAAEQMKVRLATQKVAAKIAAAEAKAASQRTRQINSLEDLKHGSSHAAKQRTEALHESRHHTRLLARIAAEHRHARSKGPEGPLGPVGAPRHREGPFGPKGPIGVVNNAVRAAQLANRGPVGPRGPVGAPQGHVVAATRAAATSIRAAVGANRGAVVRALGNLGSRFEASERRLLAAEMKLVEPIDRLRADQARIGTHAAEQRDRLIRSSDRTNNLLRKMTRNGKPPGYHKEPKGKGGSDAREAATVGSRS